MYNFAENQDTFKKPRNKDKETFHNKNKVILIGDIHLNQTNKDNFRKKFKGDGVYFKSFPGVNTNKLDYYSISMPVDEKPNTIIIHIGSNNITKSNYQLINPYEVAKGILNIGLKWNNYGVNEIAISSILVKSNSNLNKVIKQINFSLRLFKAYGFAFICNKNIDKNRLWKDGIYLTNEQ